ncbi:MAG: tryptophan synthase subunit alpha [Myxococcota bacterium]
MPYVTAGDPDLETSLAVLEALAEGGADVIELGVPADPMADGPVIEAAMGRALAGGATFARVLELTPLPRAPRDAGRALQLPEPALPRRPRARRPGAKDAGADGFLVVDLPPEEAAQLTDHTRAVGLDFIALPPTSDDDRVRAIAAGASGLLRLRWPP